MSSLGLLAARNKIVSTFPAMFPLFYFAFPPGNDSAEIDWNGKRARFDPSVNCRAAETGLLAHFRKPE